MVRNNWVEEEMASLDTGDKRLDKRTKYVLQAIIEKPNMTFTQQCQSAAELKACYRLFDSDSITPEILLEPHIAKTVELLSLLCRTWNSPDTNRVDSRVFRS